MVTSPPNTCVAVSHRAHPGALELQIGERRSREMRGDLAALGEQRDHGVGMRARDGQMVELAVLARAVGLLGRHLQNDRLGRGFHRRHRDAVGVGEILDRLDLGVLGHQRQRQGVVGGDAADIERGARLGPQGEERRRAGRGDVEVSGDQAVVHRIAAGEAEPAHLDVAETRRLGVLLDQLAVVHQREGEIGQARLDRDAEFTRLRPRLGRAERRG